MNSHICHLLKTKIVCIKKYWLQTDVRRIIQIIPVISPSVILIKNGEMSLEYVAHRVSHDYKRSLHIWLTAQNFLLHTLDVCLLVIVNDCVYVFIIVGTAIVTEQHAALWTDGRYFLQASQQMDNNWTLMKMGTVHFDIIYWCALAWSSYLLSHCFITYKSVYCKKPFGPGAAFIKCSVSFFRHFTVIISHSHLSCLYLGLKETPTQEDWLVSVLPENSKVGVDPWIIAAGQELNIIKKWLTQNVFIIYNDYDY